MEGNQGAQKMGEVISVDIPVEMMVYVDTDGEMTPRRLRYEREGGEKIIISFAPEDTIARSDCNYVGIKEKKYICSTVTNGVRTTLEIRYRVADQTWRIHRFL